MFDDHEFLLHKERYVPELRLNLSPINMFDDLGHCTRVEHGVLKILHGEVIIAKECKNVVYIF